MFEHHSILQSLAPSVSLDIVLALVTMSLSFISNGEAAVKSNPAPVSGRVSSVYSEVQSSRIDHNLPLPSVLRSSFTIVDGPPSSAAGNPGTLRSIYIALLVDLMMFIPFDLLRNLVVCLLNQEMSFFLFFIFSISNCLFVFIRLIGNKNHENCCFCFRV